MTAASGKKVQAQTWKNTIDVHRILPFLALSTFRSCGLDMLRLVPLFPNSQFMNDRDRGEMKNVNLRASVPGRFRPHCSFVPPGLSGSSNEVSRAVQLMAVARKSIVDN